MSAVVRRGARQVALSLLLNAFAVACGGQQIGPLRAITFRCVPATTARTVYVAGTFNGWNRSSTPLKRLRDGRTWQTTVRVAPGAYQYRFVVNGDTWLSDPNAPGVDDGNSNINSLLIVTPHDYDLRPGLPGDGLITASAVWHEPTRTHTVRRDETHIALMLRTRHNDVESCRILIQDDAGSVRQEPMTRYDGDALYDYWRGTSPLPAHGPLRYAFQIVDGPTVALYGPRSGLLTGAAQRTPEAWFTLDPARYPVLQVPDWPRNAVFYQIFPDRFANGDPSNDGPDVSPWGAVPTHDNRMGGDLQGVRQHLDYLQQLGVNALYFNPLFTAISNHGYDTTDYLNVDPRFGDNAQLKALTTQAHTLGWHVILDGVFNHTGVDTLQFRSLRAQGEASPYRNWYFVKRFPIEVKEGQQTYVSWFGVPALPKLNLANRDTRAFMLAVAGKWIEEAGVDGWRLDAADEVSHDYWVDFRRTVRRVNPEAYLVGEIWGDAHEWLQGDQFDSVMNYRWRSAALDFFAIDHLTPAAFDGRLSRIRDDYPDAATSVMFNTLGSHDTVRLRTLCGGDWPRERQAVLFQMTYPGTPCIYYGDEIGMEGGPDPDERRCMIWNRARWHQETLDFYRNILALRQKQTVLRRGDYRTVIADDHTGIFGFTRTCAGARALVLFNRSDRQQRIALSVHEIGPGEFMDWLPSGATIARAGDGLVVTLLPRGIALLGSE